jgi:hypothetical protein
VEFDFSRLFLRLNALFHENCLLTLSFARCLHGNTEKWGIWLRSSLGHNPEAGREMHVSVLNTMCIVFSEQGRTVQEREVAWFRH